jgi:hypothetical protein
MLLGSRKHSTQPCMGKVKRERQSGSKLLVPHAPIKRLYHGSMSIMPFFG